MNYSSVRTMLTFLSILNTLYTKLSLVLKIHAKGSIKQYSNMSAL